MLKRFDVAPLILVAIAADSKPSIAGRNASSVGILRGHPPGGDFLSIHCIIHIVHLVAMCLSYEDVEDSCSN